MLRFSQGATTKPNLLVQAFWLTVCLLPGGLFLTRRTPDCRAYPLSQVSQLEVHHQSAACSAIKGRQRLEPKTRVPAHAQQNLYSNLTRVNSGSRSASS